MTVNEYHFRSDTVTRFMTAYERRQHRRDVAINRVCQVVVVVAVCTLVALWLS